MGASEEILFRPLRHYPLNLNLKTFNTMKTTKAQLESDVQSLSRENHATSVALNEIIRGRVQWFKLGKIKVGVCQPAGPHGGIVIQTDMSASPVFSFVQFFEDWFKPLQDCGSSGIAELQQLRELSWLAQEYIRAEQSKG